MAFPSPEEGEERRGEEGVAIRRGWARGEAFERIEREVGVRGGRANSHLQLLLVLDEVDVLVIAALVAGRHRVRVPDPGRARVLVAGSARRHRQQKLRPGLLHALVHPVDTVHGGAAGAEVRQVEERAEAHDAERHEHQEDQVLLARTEGPSRE